MTEEPTHEGPSPYHPGLTTHRGRREDCTGPDCGPVEDGSDLRDRVAAVAGILRHTADLVDREDLPQTAENTADFCDGARWATAEMRRIADEVTAEDPSWRPDGLTELAHGLTLNAAERAMLSYALKLTGSAIASEPDEFTTVDRAAVDSLKRFAGEEVPDPYATEDFQYQVVGDWGVDGADSEGEARADAASALRVHPHCGARAQQRIVREWPDGSEFYGPWTDLTS